jgi:hypothetical protein
MSFEKDLKLLFQILLTLEIPNAKKLEPKRDAFRLWELKYGILDDPIIEKHCATFDKAVQSIELSDVLRFVKAMSPDEKAALCKRIGA